ncbi:DUF5924 family protein [Halomonas halocynthiae]|uniref:DUF5924 family protein n=1 Tax=Halomonas halocynthiae TaxID=176290 RepID=UPI0004126C94|nr:DUF5924 family protein [Halomonas halocynthiae]
MASTPPFSDPQATAQAPWLKTWQKRLARLSVYWRRWGWLWPPAAFASGMASFFLVERQQWLGVALALGMLLAWGLLLGEGVIIQWLKRRGYPSLPTGTTSFIAQLIHQETLFFCLPFLLATTVWSSGQALFTSAMIVLALLSIIDPLYYRLASHRWLYFFFHAQCVFLVALVTLPTLLHLNTQQSMLLALAAMIIVSLPSLMQLRSLVSRQKWLSMLAALPLLAVLAWLGRGWVPPASLWLSASALSPAFDTSTRTPRGEIRLSPKVLNTNGLFAYTAIHAPRGLREEVVHEWRHNGKLIERIPLEIHGGREEGYRAWTHKLNFPAKSEGAWRIDIMTNGGQRIGTVRFNVSDDNSIATLANGQSSTPLGIPGLVVRHLVARPSNTPDPENTSDHPQDEAAPEPSGEEQPHHKPENGETTEQKSAE